MKKRILSLVLALLMALSVFPAPALAADTEKDYNADIGKYVQLNPAVDLFSVCYSETVDGTLYTNAHEDFTDGTIFEITDWYADDSSLWYRVKFYSGSVIESSFTEGFPEDPWFKQTSANELVFMDTCDVCELPDCTTTHVWCETCEKYDCGIDHSTTEPENPSEGGTCEICGQTDCNILHFWCDLCQKYDCGVSHSFCSVCGKLECGVTHVYCRFCNAYDCSMDHEDPFKPLTTPAIPANPALPEGEGVFVLDSNGNEITTDGLILQPGIKSSISAWPSGDAENVTYKWQICYNNANSLWIDIYGQTGKGILVSTSVVKGAVDHSGLTYIRCVTYDGIETRTSDPIPVRVVEEQDVSYSVSSGSARSAAAPSGGNEIMLANEVTYAVTIRYEVKHAGVEAPQPKVYNLNAGDNYILDVTHPTMAGYYPGDAAGNPVSQTTMTIVDIQAPVDIVIYYWPDEVDFVVNHYKQNVGDDNYTLWDTDIISDKKTGEPVGEDLADTYVGFDTLTYDTAITVAADGSTVVNIYYDRQYFMLSLDLNGGYGAEPIYARYGTPVTIPDPQRTGYTFTGWSPALPGEILQKTEHTARWAKASTNFTVAFWYENANDEDYTFVGSVQQTATTGSKVNGATYKDVSFANRDDAHFTYEKADTNAEIAADGSTVVNVYFSRNSYTLTYLKWQCVHNHTSGCTYCSQGYTYEHTCTHETCCSNQSGIFHFTHGYSACPYDKKEHTHSASCCTHTKTYGCPCTSTDAGWYVSYTGTFKYEQDVDAVHAAQGAERWCPAPGSGFSSEGLYGTSPAVGTYSSMHGSNVTFYQSSAGSVQYYFTYWLETYDGSGTRNYQGRNFAQGTTFTPKMGAVGYKLDYQAGRPAGFSDFEAWASDSKGGNNVAQLVAPNGQFSGNTYIYYNFYYIRNTYTLTYFNGSTQVVTKTMKYDEPLTSSYNLQNLSLTSPYGDGYEFAGWYLDPECTVPVSWNSTRMPDGGMAVYAKWEPITHTVKTYLTIDAIGGTPINTYGISHGEMYEGTVAIPKNGSLNFIGWFYEDDGKEYAYDFSMPVYRDMNLYGKWNSNVVVTGKIYYVDENGNELARPTDITGLVGDTKTYSAKLSTELGDGNTLYLPNVTSHSIKFSENSGQNTFTFVYKAMEAVGYTIKFVNKDNPSQTLFPDITGESTSPTVFYDAMENGKTVEKYYIDKNSKTFVLSSDEELNVFYFYYTYDPGKATVQVQHYIQNLDGTGWDFHSENPSTVEELNTVINATDRKLTIKGFTYDHATFNGDVATQATLTVGLTIKLYYTRNSYNYTFRFVYRDSQGDEVEFPNSAVTGTEKYNASIRQTAKSFPGYTTSTRTQSLVVFYEESSNVFTFVYEEADVTIRYQVGAVKGGTVSVGSETLKAVTGTAIGSSAAVSNSNYRFIGWFTDYSGNGTAVSTDLAFTPAKNSDNVYETKTFYALFEEIMVDICYQVQMPVGATVQATLDKYSEQVSVVTGIATGADVASIPAGYKFEGWYDANGNRVGSTESFNPSRPVDQWIDGTTFTAKFVEKEATIRYAVVGAGTVSVSTEKVNMVTGDATGSTAVPTEYFGNFVGWYSDEACTTQVGNSAKFTPVIPADGWAENQTYYAKFEWIEYTITYVDRDKTYTQTYVPGDTLQLPAVENGNYRLDWTLKTTDGNWDDTVLKEYIDQNTPIESYGNVTLETKWTIDVVWVDWDFDSTNYDVSSWLHTDQNWSYGTAFAYDGPALSREADAQYTYTFQGWNQMHIEQIADKPIIVFKAVYAEKKNQYTITFVLGNGQPDVKLTQDWGTAVAAPANLNKEGYTFLKWDADVPETMPTSDMTITALWSINKYTIKFVDEDGTVLQSGLLDHGTMPTAPADPNKAEDDAYTYVFNSWDRVIVVATEDATYTATYTPTEKTCVITYVAGQGGTVTLNGADNWLAEASETVPVKTGTPVGATAKPDTGYKFAGWYAGDTRVSENVNFVPGKTDDPYAAATYTARFELAVVDLTIKVDDPQGDESYIFTVTGNPSDGSEFNPVQVVLTKDNDYTVTIKDVPVGIYTVHEEDGWSWRQNAVDDQTFLLDKAATGTFKFEKVDRIYWLSGESYNKRKKGVNSNG